MRLPYEIWFWAKEKKGMLIYKQTLVRNSREQVNLRTNERVEKTILAWMFE